MSKIALLSDSDVERLYGACRVRAEAAVALGSTAGETTGWTGLDHLIRFYRSQTFDPATQLPRPRQLSDLAEYIVDQVSNFSHQLTSDC